MSSFKSTDSSLEQVVVFVGAGISVSAGLPDFDTLREELYADVVHSMWLAPRTQRRITERLRALAPEYAVSLLDDDGKGPREYICERMQNARPSSEHFVLAEALRHGACVYTPNFDSLIESAVDFPVSIAIRRSLEDDPGSAHILKLHGTCPEIAVRAEDVMLSITGPWADRFLSDCRTADSHLVVWGYRGADPDLAPLVREGAALATQCTWIAFSQNDLDRVRTFIGNSDHTSVVCAHSQTGQARRLAAAILDPKGEVDLNIDDNRIEGSESHYSYVIRHRATKARALGHLGGVRIGRRAWWIALFSGDRAAVRPIGRSYLFDSRLVQTATLMCFPPVALRRPSNQLWNVILTAAEGRGARSTDDRLVRDVQVARRQLAAKEQRMSTEVAARAVSMMRRRGLLLRAQHALDELEQSIREHGEVVTATWRGRLAYERAIILRSRGEIDLAHRTLSSIDTENIAIVGANWSMWLEDEKCALAVWREDTVLARKHFSRAQELASAYGEHPRSTIDLAIRKLQIGVTEGCSYSEVTLGARNLEKLALRGGFLTPSRRAWLNGVKADAARRYGQYELAVKYYRRLQKSPDLMHHLGGVVGILACEKKILLDPIVEIVKATGDNSTTRIIEQFLQGTPSFDLESIRWYELLKSQRGFVFLS